MKVLHLITRLDPGGSAENTILSCQQLADSGWDVVLAAGPGKTENLGWVEASGVPSIVVPSLRRDPHPVADLQASWQLLRLLRRERPDILHTHSAKAGILGRWAGWLARVPHIVHTPHGHVLYGYARGFKNWLYLLAERITAPITDRLVALSEGEMSESVEHGIGRADQWVVIPSGVPSDALVRGRAEFSGAEGSPAQASDAEPAPQAAADSAKRPIRIGSVARLEPVKGIDILVRAAAHLSTRHWRRETPFEILVWGDGEIQADLLRLIEREGVRGTVHLEGTTQEVDDFLTRLDIYVQPSRNEGMGRAMVLAQAQALPVVATRVCGIPDVVRDGESGVLVDPEDPAALAGALERLILDADLRSRLGEGAVQWISQVDETGHIHFSVEAMVGRLLRLYSELTTRAG
jgi:glycosyltransferase involved in cell wall biosynthesis